MLQEIHVSSPITSRNIASAIALSKSTHHRNMETLAVRLFAGKLKPILMEPNRKDRMRWALEKASLKSQNQVLVDDIKETVKLNGNSFKLSKSARDTILTKRGSAALRAFS